MLQIVELNKKDQFHSLPQKRCIALLTVTLRQARAICPSRRQCNKGTLLVINVLNYTFLAHMLLHSIALCYLKLLMAIILSMGTTKKPSGLVPLPHPLQYESPN